MFCRLSYGSPYLQAKNTIQSRPDWGAVVRYGDTDSLFVHLPGKTKDEAFKIGDEIADTITRMNPKPIKLKFEKVGFAAVTRLGLSDLIHGVYRCTYLVSSWLKSATSDSSLKVSKIKNQSSMPKA